MSSDSDVQVSIRTEFIEPKPKRPRLTRRDHWRLFKRDLRWRGGI